MLTLLTDADVYSPKHLGRCDLLCSEHVILKIGKIDHKKLFESGLEIEVVNMKGAFALPGIVDPHMHLLGGSGENGGFSSQTPEISLSEIVEAGVTSAIGTLGVDTTMKTMAGLLAKVKGLNDEGLASFLWTGGYDVPPSSIMETEREDIMFIDEVIGTGELAIADERSVEPKPEKLARVIVQTHNGGMLAGKAGVTHFHIGPGKRRLQCIWDTLEFAPDISPEWLYPTHIERTEKLIQDAIKLTKKGSTVDMDTTEEKVLQHLKTYISNGGDLKKLTLSSDASKTAASNTLTQIQKILRAKKFKLADLWPLVSSNVADVLKLKKVGVLEEGRKPNFIVLDQKTYDLKHVIASGKFFIRDFETKVKERFLRESNREIVLKGEDFKKEEHHA